MQATPNFQLRIKAINDHGYQRLIRRSEAIAEQYPTFTTMRRNTQNAKDDAPLNLAEYYAWMRYAFGNSSRFYDDWKGGFAFVFQVEAVKGEHTYPHTLRIVNRRNTVEFMFARVLDSVDNAKPLLCRQPIEEEMSAKVMEFIDSWIYGFLQGVRKLSASCEIPSFYKTVGSNWITYGYVDGEFFEHHHDELESFESETDRYSARLRSLPPESWDTPLITDWLNINVPSKNAGTGTQSL